MVAWRTMQTPPGASFQVSLMNAFGNMLRLVLIWRTALHPAFAEATTPQMDPNQASPITQCLSLGWSLHALSANLSVHAVVAPKLLTCHLFCIPSLPHWISSTRMIPNSVHAMSLNYGICEKDIKSIQQSAVSMMRRTGEDTASTKLIYMFWLPHDTGNVW